MKSTLIMAVIASTVLVSCAKKEVILGPESSSSSSTSNSSTNDGKIDPITGKKTIVDRATQPPVDEKICIDDAKLKDIEDNEKISEVIDDTDFNYCNGLRVRLKIFKYSTGDYRAYGFVISSSGRQSCVRQARDFSKVPMLGFKGTLLGSGIKVSLGGHEYDSDNKLKSSKKLSAKHVRFGSYSFSGELGVFENGTLTCWAIQ